jgi:hypothetical protein
MLNVIMLSVVTLNFVMLNVSSMTCKQLGQGRTPEGPYVTMVEVTDSGKHSFFSTIES